MREIHRCRRSARVGDPTVRRSHLHSFFIIIIIVVIIVIVIIIVIIVIIIVIMCSTLFCISCLFNVKLIQTNQQKGPLDYHYYYYRLLFVVLAVLLI